MRMIDAEEHDKLLQSHAELQAMKQTVTDCMTGAPAITAVSHALVQEAARIAAERPTDATSLVLEAAASIICQQNALLNSPENEKFMKGVRLEIAHQVQRWGTAHDRAKRPADWFWLIGYLAGKALHHHQEATRLAGLSAPGQRDLDMLAHHREKAMHHTISTGAALGNWHVAIKIGRSDMQPGSSDVQRILEEAFGPDAIGD
jgi:hypothetical protein